jgi:WD40 repeat protein
MTASQPARIFISYATKDGAEYAVKVRNDLEAQGFSIWHDIVALQGNADWWSQIESALRSKELQHFILVVTPGALASSAARQEIRLARQEGKTVSPVKGPDIVEMSQIPRWLGNLYDLEVQERRTNLLRLLELPSVAKRVPMMAPEPPVDFVARPTEFKALKAQLLDPATSDAVAITAALRGAGGYGKTTLAKALAHDIDIQNAYFDGILWVELGEKGGERVTTLINDLVALITGRSPQITTIEAARTVLAEALGDRRILLIIDDIWQKQHLEPFMHGGQNTTRLLTTRFDKELPDKSVRQTVDAMQPSEARALLEWDLPKDQATTQVRELGELSTKLHDWAQLLKLANGFLRDRVVKYRQPLSGAILEARKRLVAKGLPAFDDPKAKDYEGRHKSVAAAIGLNLDLLGPDKRDRFGELAVFPEDADIPIGIVARLWAGDGGLDEFATLDLLTELYDLSLLLGLDLDRRTIRVHDTTRQFLRDEAKRKNQLANQHKRLIRSIGDLRGATDASVADADYFYRYLPSHLSEADERATLDALLLDPRWLVSKLATTHSPHSLIGDYEQHGEGQLQKFIDRTLRLIAGICGRDPSQLLPQLLGRLMACSDLATPTFLDQARQLIIAPALIAERPSLTPPGAETARFQGYGGEVNALAVLPGGMLASGCFDATIRIWDLANGTERARLLGHAGWVNALALLPFELLASGARDKTIRIWDIANNSEKARLNGHQGGVYALTLLPNGRLASCSTDRTIRIWDLAIGAETVRLSGHRAGVYALAVLPDGRLVSGSRDSTIRVWNIETGREVAQLTGSGGTIYAVTLLSDGRIASASTDRLIRIWDVASGAETARFEGHTEEVRALALLPDGRLASGSRDRTIRIWDVVSGIESDRFDGHGGEIRALSALPEGYLASSSFDGTVRIWDLTSTRQATKFEKHQSGVNSLVVGSSGYVVSGSRDKTIRMWDLSGNPRAPPLCKRGGGRINALALLSDTHLASASTNKAIRIWNLESCAETGKLEGHDGEVQSLLSLPDKRLASGSTDKTIRLWDIACGAELTRLEGSGGAIYALALLPDGRLVSGAADKAIRLWDLRRGRETLRLLGHRGEVRALVLLPNGLLVSGGADMTIRIWDIDQGTEVAQCVGHKAEVRALALFAGGLLASGSADGTIRVWNVTTQMELTQLEVDGAVISVAGLPDDRLVAGDALGRLHWLKFCF